MDVRETLVEMIESARYWCSNTSEEIADNLLDSGVTVQEWISVNDRLPEDDLPKDTKKKMIRCLVYTNKGTIKPCVRQRWEVNGKLVPWQWNKDFCKADALDVLSPAAERRMIMAKCTGKRCPMQTGYKVDECNHKDCNYRTEPITNADRIRAMSDEELAKLIAENAYTGACNDFGIPHQGQCCHNCERCDAIIKWLKHPAE